MTAEAQECGAISRDALSFYDAAAHLPPQFSAVLQQVEPDFAQQITEIRLRSGRPVVLTTARENLLVDGAGCVVNAQSCAQQTASGEKQYAKSWLRTSHAELAECLSALCGYSVHSFSECIARGFVPVPGGHRAGVCGMALTECGELSAVKNITSINLRVARTARQTCDPALIRLLEGRGSLVLAGEPGSGKTTLLRAAIRFLCESGRRVAVVDERFELEPVEQAGFTTPMPLHCDVLSGYPKHTGMLHALRSLAPEVLVCDEIGGMEDVRAVEQAANSGVRLLVTLHGETRETLLRRPQARALLETGAFSDLVFLEGRSAPGKIREVQAACRE